MNATDKEKIDINSTATTNQRLITILLVLLVILVALVVLGIIGGFLMMGGGMMGMMNMGGMTLAPGASAGVTNDMANACIEMMRNIQSSP